jgi:hypothetical protein
MKRFLVLGVFVCLVSCIADTSDPSATSDPPEDTAETQEPMTAASPTPEEVKSSLTGWVAHMSGTDFIPCRGPLDRSEERSPCRSILRGLEIGVAAHGDQAAVICGASGSTVCRLLAAEEP